MKTTIRILSILITLALLAGCGPGPTPAPTPTLPPTATPTATALPTATPVPAPTATPEATATSVPIQINNPETYPASLHTRIEQNMTKFVDDLHNGVVYDTTPEYQRQLDEDMKAVRRLWVEQQGVNTTGLTDAQILERVWQLKREAGPHTLEEVMVPLSPVEIRAAYTDPNYAIAHRGNNGLETGLFLSSASVDRDFVRSTYTGMPPFHFPQLGQWIDMPRPPDGESALFVEGVAPLFGVDPSQGVIVALKAVNPDGSNYYIYRTAFFTDYTPPGSLLIYENTNEIKTLSSNGIIIKPTLSTITGPTLTPDLLLEKIMRTSPVGVRTYSTTVLNTVEKSGREIFPYGLENIGTFSN